MANHHTPWAINAHRLGRAPRPSVFGASFSGRTFHGKYPQRNGNETATTCNSLEVTSEAPHLTLFRNAARGQNKSWAEETLLAKRWTRGFTPQSTLRKPSHTFLPSQKCNPAPPVLPHTGWKKKVVDACTRPARARPSRPSHQSPRADLARVVLSQPMATTATSASGARHAPTAQIFILSFRRARSRRSCSPTGLQTPLEQLRRARTVQLALSHMQPKKRPPKAVHASTMLSAPASTNRACMGHSCMPAHAHQAAPLAKTKTKRVHFLPVLRRLALACAALEESICPSGNDTHFTHSSSENMATPAVCASMKRKQ